MSQQKLKVFSDAVLAVLNAVKCLLLFGWFRWWRCGRLGLWDTWLGLVWRLNGIFAFKVCLLLNFEWVVRHGTALLQFLGSFGWLFRWLTLLLFVIYWLLNRRRDIL